MTNKRHILLFYYFTMLSDWSRKFYCK